jgi:hypothetical protein
MTRLTSKYEKCHSGNARTALHCDLSFNKGKKPPNIEQRLENVYADRVTKKAKVHFWIPEVRKGREDLSDDERPGRPPNIGLGDVLVHRLEADLHTTAREIAGSLGISSQAVINHMLGCLAMKSFHLRWVPQTFTDAQKAARVSCTQEMIRFLDNGA